MGDSTQRGAYEAKHLAIEQNMVVVAMNYRLGILGGFASMAFAHEHPGKAIGG